MNALRSTCCALITIAFLAAGCGTPKPAPNHLEGWKGLGTAYVIGCPFGQRVMDDYQSYIKSLPPVERSAVHDHDIRFYERRAGERAVEIAIPFDGTWWKHVLIYDQNNRRVQAVKRLAGHYQS